MLTQTRINVTFAIRRCDNQPLESTSQLFFVVVAFNVVPLYNAIDSYVNPMMNEGMAHGFTCS
jgi:hypothetical protein